MEGEGERRRERRRVGEEERREEERRMREEERVRMYLVSSGELGEGKPSYTPRSGASPRSSISSGKPALG